MDLPLRLARRAVAAALLGSLAHPAKAPAERQALAAAQARPARAPPRQLPWQAAAALVSGALGALAVEAGADRRRMQPRPRSQRAALAQGAARAGVGAVFGLFLLALAPAQGSWLRLAGASFGGGVAGGAILLAMLASRRVQAADRERAAAREQAAMAATLGIEVIETFRVIALSALPCTAAPHPDGGGFERLVNAYAERAKAELAAVAG